MKDSIGMLAPSQVIYRETFKLSCAHTDCKIPIVVVVERIKGGGTSSIEVEHEHPPKSSR